MISPLGRRSLVFNNRGLVKNLPPAATPVVAAPTETSHLSSQNIPPKAPIEPPKEANNPEVAARLLTRYLNIPPWLEGARVSYLGKGAHLLVNVNNVPRSMVDMPSEYMGFRVICAEWTNSGAVYTKDGHIKSSNHDRKTLNFTA